LQTPDFWNLDWYGKWGQVTSVVQRHLKIGYNRAIRLLDAMEHSGVVSALNAAGKRQVLVSQSDIFLAGSTIGQPT
jgi:DNA segregation ATPase FtsK/SpoIIIE-like protein